MRPISPSAKSRRFCATLKVPVAAPDSAPEVAAVAVLVPLYSQDTVSDQRENSTQDFGAPGRKSAGDISIEVIDNTNTEHAEQNKAVTLMAEGSSGFIVRRRGMATDAALAAGQKLTVVSVKCGEKKVLNPDANTMIRSAIPLFAQAPGWESETAEIAAAAASHA